MLKVDAESIISMSGVKIELTKNQSGTLILLRIVVSYVEQSHLAKNGSGIMRVLKIGHLYVCYLQATNQIQNVVTIILSWAIEIVIFNKS